MTDSPVPIWRNALVSALILERFFKDVYEPAVPGKELSGPMYLKRGTFRLRWYR